MREKQKRGVVRRIMTELSLRREAQGVSERKLCRSAKVNRSTYRFAHEGRCVLRLDDFTAVCAKLGVNPARVIERATRR